MELYERFLALPRPSQARTFFAEQGSSFLRVAKSYEGHPAILVAFDGGSDSSPTRRLTNIVYSPPSIVEILGPDGSRSEKHMAVLECRSVDRELWEYFFRVVTTVLVSEADGTQLTFERGLGALIVLFRRLEGPATRSVQGLWAELAIISWARDPGLALASWHSDPRQLHDFSAGSFRLEVKSTTRSMREHSFSLDQLAVMAPGCTLIASLLLTENGGGENIFDLAQLIMERASGPEQARRLESIIAESLGSGWRDAGGLRYGTSEARRSLCVYRAETIPTVPQPMPAEVKNVRFDVDLSGAPPLELQRARSCGGLFESLLPP